MKYYAFLIYFAMIAINSEAQDWANLSRYHDDNQKLEAPVKNEHRIVFMGNSITEGWVNARPDFFKKNGYINRGIGGQTTPQMLLRFRADVIDLRPMVVVLLAGVNDIAGNTGPSTLKMITDNIISMAVLAKDAGIKVVLSSVLPAYDFPWAPGKEPAGKVIELNRWLKNYADTNGHVYLDYFSKMADERSGLPAELSGDEIHPNENGYIIMEPLVKEAIARALK